MRALTCGLVATASLALLLIHPGAATASATPAGAALSLTTPGNTDAYVSRTLFELHKPAGSEATEGIGFKAGIFYTTTDQGGGQSLLCGYDATGKRVYDAGLIEAGHANAVDVAGDTAYITKTGGSATAILAYSISQKVFLRTYPVPELNDGAVAGLDRQNHQLDVLRGGEGGPHELQVISTDTGKTLSTVAMRVTGATQGVVAYNGAIMVLTSFNRGGPPHGRSDQLTVYSPSTGRVIKQVQLSLTEEAEGLTVDRRTGRVFYGALYTDRILELTVA